MVGKNIMVAAAACFAMSSAMALPTKDDGTQKGKHLSGDDKPHLPHRPGGPSDKDCSSTASLAPYPTGDPTSSGFVTGTGFGTGTIGTLSTGTGIARRAALPDKGKGGGKDDGSPSLSASITSSGPSPTTTISAKDNLSRTVDDNGGSRPSGVEDNTGRAGDDNGRPTATGVSTIDDSVSTTTVTLTSTITTTPTLTITISTSVPMETSSSSSSKGRKGRKPRTSGTYTGASTTSTSASTTSIDDSSATPS